VESSKVGNLQRLEEVFHYCLSTTWIKVSSSPLHTLMKLHTLEPVQELNLKLDIQIHGRHAMFWQARPSEWQPHQQRAAAAFYSAKSRQGLGGLASRGGLELTSDA
jgi:hypothetical protein